MRREQHQAQIGGFRRLREQLQRLHEKGVGQIAHATPMMFDFPSSERASGLGRYPICAAMAMMRSRLSGDRLEPGVKARDTADCDACRPRHVVNGNGGGGGVAGHGGGGSAGERLAKQFEYAFNHKNHQKWHLKFEKCHIGKISVTMYS
jgi:hypothetical protein